MRVALLLLVGMVAAGALSIDLRSKRTRLDDARAVYVTVLRSHCMSDGNSPVERVVVVSTLYPGSDAWIREPEDPADLIGVAEIPFEALDPSTERDYRAHTSGTFPAAIPFDVPIVRVELDDIEGDDAMDWAGFRSRFPNATGYIVFSPIGFSQDRNEALVHVGWMRGFQFGRGWYVRLERLGGVWRVVEDDLTWIS